MRLCELSEEFQNVLESIEAACDEGGVVPPDLMSVLDGIQGRLEDKLGNYAGMIKSLAAQKKMVDDERDRLNRQSKSAESHIDFLKSRAKDAMEKAGIEKLTVGTRSLRIQKNSVATLTIADESKVPDTFWYQPPKEIEREAVRKAIAEGQEIEGVTLATGNHLRVS